VDYLLRQQVVVVARLNHGFECPRQVDYIQIFEEAGLSVEPCVFPDGGVPSKAVVRSFLRVVHRAREQGTRVAVHCMGGLGRTGVIIGAYAASHHGMSGKAFHGWTRMCRPGTVQTTKQEFFLRSMKPGKPSKRGSFASMLRSMSTGSSPTHSQTRSEGALTRAPTTTASSRCTEEKSRETESEQDLAPWNKHGIMELEGMKVIIVGGGVADI